MALNIALSGLAAAQKDMNTTSNNIANANTFGFKESRSEFGDVYSASIFSNAKTTTGSGVQTAIVAQQFHEGSSIYTNNPLDLRISGNGYFAVANDKLVTNDNLLTRNGAFHLDKNNNIVNSEGQFLLGYKVDNDTLQVGSFEPNSLNVPDQFGQPRASDNVEIGLNLPAGAAKKDPTLFNPEDPDTYNKATSSTIFDSLGQPYKLTSYYVKDNLIPNKWAVYYSATDPSGEKPLNLTTGEFTSTKGHVGHSVEFNTDGSINTVNGGVPITTVEFGSNGSGMEMNGADESQSLIIKFDTPTQYASPFEMRKFTENGATTGYLSKVDIDPKGTIMAMYSNGENIALGRLAMVRVSNQQGMSQAGNTQWKVTQQSGNAMWGEAMQGAFGKIKSGTIEQSNIDMTQELVDLITAQRNFQANSRSLEVGNQMQQTILQIR
ncbi:flagellar hook protein FlgE [Candidatus Enterovibrio escicola]|uniref:Flagellar hook protein FlgE n=1 Tax=Candidatus Enterovibrio escicola TaxID=1927127 RepID=A0A2A5T1D9_9GAMM|nr:flagellar hook protein FlgE [Candidatus Enterovibrio escacola]PCS21966.1 Flagellar hook protein FlgE [Candidatus Enterovibrio escacola]